MLLGKSGGDFSELVKWVLESNLVVSSLKQQGHTDDVPNRNLPQHRGWRTD